jgi:hydroxymethylbilane synthase
MNVLRIATRRSRLALWQAHEVARQLRGLDPTLECELVEITTRGDRFLDGPLGAIGGKGLFVKELEHAMLDGRADLAVHSIKDVPVELPDGLHLPSVLARASPFDALVSRDGCGLDELVAGARVGSSSLRRQSQIRARRPDLCVVPVRGNVDTRIGKLDAGEFDALVLACAGLERLALSHRIAQVISADVILPAIGQGAMGVECREGDDRVESLVARLNHEATFIAIRAERALNRALGGGCHVPVAGLACISGTDITLRGLVASIDGSRVLERRATGSVHEPEAVGHEVARALEAAGADRILLTAR